MKNVIYYSVLFIVFVLLNLAISTILLIIGLLPYVVSFSYSLGNSFANPRLWLLCLGITMLLRSFIYRRFFNVDKKFRKDIPLVLIAISLILYIIPFFVMYL